MDPARNRRPAVAATPRRRWQAVTRCAGVAIVVAVVVSMLALQCDVYGAFAEGSALSFDGSALRTLLASVGLGSTSTAP